jgi:hypothetical protein|nr:MAG TPA: hypothetical protein [Caudoviricetes sp.]
MFKATIRARSLFNDEITTQTLYFNMSRREMMDFVKKYDGINSFREYLKSAKTAEDVYTIVEFIDDVLGSAYGERQGERFVKSEVIRDNFLNGPLYEALFEKMLNDGNFAVDLLTGIFPEKIMEQVKKDEEFQKAQQKLEELTSN